jgi:hypothetical protein
MWNRCFLQFFFFFSFLKVLVFLPKNVLLVCVCHLRCVLLVV